MSQPDQQQQQQPTEEQQDQGPGPIESLEEALRNREVGIQLYNKNLFEPALAIQMRVLEFYSKTYGDVALECGLPYLDYGITLLTIIQTGSGDDADAALAGNSGNEDLEEDLSLCYENLDTARVCFEKGIAKLEKSEQSTDEEKKKVADEIEKANKRLAEVHDTLADYFMEVDDEESAINAYTKAIEIREKVDPKSRAIISGHYRVGKAYYRLQIFEEAAKSYEKAVELADADAANIDADLLAEMKESLADAQETVKSGGLGPVREEVEQMFPSEDSPEQLSQSSKSGGSAKKGKKNPLFEEINKDPTEDSLQLAPGVVVPFLPTDASNSMSHFPSQGHSRASAGKSNSENQPQQEKGKAPQPTPVNTNVVIRRKTQQGSTNSNSSAPAPATTGARREREGEEAAPVAPSQ